MNNSLLLGLWKHLLRIPRHIWHREVKRSAQAGHHRQDFMTPDHQAVRDYVVVELPRAGAPLSAQAIAASLNLPLERTQQILEELERGMTFLFRNEQGDVAWAYPVTVEPTPHRITFSTGEQVYAAWGIDAIATPFVQGQLRKEPLSFQIETSCAHCGRPIHIQMEADLRYTIQEPNASPLVFVPMVDFDRLEDPSIIDAF